jgi:hypothetical protein
MSGVMAAMVGYLLSETFTAPAIAAIFVTSDGFILARHEGDIGYDNFIGSEANLRRNWVSLLEAADLTNEERSEATSLYNLRVCA